MAAFALFAQGGLPARGSGCAGTGTEAAGQAEVSVHPVSPLAPATLVPFGLMSFKSCWEHCKTAQTLLPIPSSRDAPAVRACPHGIACARPSSRLCGWKVSQQPDAQDPATQLCPGRGPAWVQDGKSGSQCRGWEEASCLPQGDSGQPEWEKGSAQGSRLMVKTGPLLLHFLLTWELPEMGPPCSSVPPGVNWIWRSC